VGPLKPIREYVDTLVHPSVQHDALTTARHRAFIAPRLIGSAVALGAFPAYLAMRGVPSVLEVMVFVWLIAPILTAYFLSRTGHYESAHVLSSLALTGLVTIVAAKTGGITSFAAIWLVIVPLEAALSASRRVVATASTLALAAAGLLMFCSIAQILPTPAPSEQGEGALTALGIISAALYATGLALGAESLARTSFWLFYAEEDRYRLLRATRANFSPIFLMFPDPRHDFSELFADAISGAPGRRHTDDGGVAHRLWRVDAPEMIAAFQHLLGEAKAYIADGHHRHATALRYRDETGPEGAWTLGYFTPIESPGLVVLPYHRILAEGPGLEEAAGRLRDRFRLTPAESVSTAADAVAASEAPYAFALAEPKRGAVVAEALPGAEALLPGETPPCLRALDTFFLHHAVLGPLLGVRESAVRYVHSQAEAEEAVRSGACRLAVLLRGTPVRQIVDVAEAGESMPAKSTFFHPKLPSGLVIHTLVA